MNMHGLTNTIPSRALIERETDAIIAHQIPQITASVPWHSQDTHKAQHIKEHKQIKQAVVQLVTCCKTQN